MFEVACMDRWSPPHKLVTRPRSGSLNADRETNEQVAHTVSLYRWSGGPSARELFRTAPPSRCPAGGPPIARQAPRCSCRCSSGSRPPTSGLFVLFVAVGAGAVGSAQGAGPDEVVGGVLGSRRVFQAVKVLVRWWRRQSPARLSGQVWPAGWG